MQGRIHPLVSGGTAQMRQCRLNPLSVTIFVFVLRIYQQHRNIVDICAGWASKNKPVCFLQRMVRIIFLQHLRNRDSLCRQLGSGVAIHIAARSVRGAVRTVTPNAKNSRIGDS